MRFEHEGVSLWFGTPDAPAPGPGEAIEAGSDVTVTAGVRPIDTSNKIEVRYRTNQGSAKSIAAKWLRNDFSHRAQYFSAQLPPFQAGDVVEYTVICRFAGRQVPSPEQAKHFASSFHVVDAGSTESKPLAGSTAVKESAMLKADGASRSNTGTISPASIASQPMAPPPTSSHGLAKDHSLSQHEAQKVALKSLLSTSSMMADTKLQDTFISLSAEHQGSSQDFWGKLREQPEFKAPGTVEHLQFTLQLGVLTQNNLPLVQALQGMRQQGTLQSVRDLTKLDANVWTNLINTPGNAISTPTSIPGETQEEKVANYVSSIVDSLHRAFPTAYVAQEVARNPEIDLKLVKSVLTQNPSLNLHSQLPSNLQIIGISPADQEKAKASLEALRQEARIFPGLDHTAMLNTNNASGFQNPTRQAVSQFFENAPDFDFRDTHIDTYIAQNGATALKGVDDKYKDAIPALLKPMQRVFRVSPTYETMNVLLGEGLDSAHSIATIPQSTFVAQFQDKLGGEAQASMIHATAQHIHAMAINTFAHVHQAMNDVTPRVIGSNDHVKDFIKQIPNWSTLFGSLDLCGCEHCRSVYGPASYFVDILQFLKKTPVEGGKSIQDILFERRPDLPFIKLNCENAEKPLPYIDLINEMLETYIALDGTNIDGPALVHDTAADTTPDELSANPAYTRDDAYDKLKKAIYPFTLPYNRPLEVVRAYLEQLDSSRYELMRTFQVASVPTYEEIGYEYLKISPEEYNILIGAADTPPRQLWNFYGYDSNTVFLPSHPNGTDPDFHPIDPNFEFWNNNLARVPEFLKRTGITYLDLIALLKTRFINPKQFGDLKKALTLHVPSGHANQPLSDACDLNNTTITNLDIDVLKKIYRFIRLWRKLGWQMQDLDRTITALEATAIDPPFLQKLSQVKQLQGDLKLPLVQLLSLWANIDGDGDDSLYNKLFQNKAIRNPVDADFTLVQKQGKSELAIAIKNAKISMYIPTILAALRIGATELTVLTTLVLTDDVLNLANLSTLYRHAVLARALKLSINDLLDLKVLTGINPLTDINPALAGSPALAIEFVNKVHKIRQSGFTVAQLNYLYRHLYNPKQGIAPTQQSIDLLVKSILDGLRKVVSDTVVTPDPSGDILRSKLAIVLDSKLVNLAMALTDGSAVYSTSLDATPTIPDSMKDKISYDDKNKKLRYIGNMTHDDETLLLSLPGGDGNYKSAVSDLFQQPRDLITKNMAFLNPTDAIKHLIEDEPWQVGGQPPTKEEKITYILTPLMTYLQTYLQTSLSQNLMKQKLSEALKLDTAMIDLLLGSVLPPPVPLVLKSHTHPSQYAMADFLALLDGGLSVTYFANKNLDPTIGNTVSRIDPTIDFDWQTGSPDSTIIGNTFSARWTGKVLAQKSEVYTFTTHTNNGVRLWVDNQLLINDWNNQPAVEHSATITLKAGQLYDITVEYYNDSAKAVAKLWWSSPTTARAIIPQSQLYPSSALSSAYTMFSLLHKVALLVNTFKLTVQEVTYLSARGLSATYFSNKNLDPNTGTSVYRIDPTVNFNWGADSPDPTITGNTFSARWIGKILAPTSETYTFTTHTNNGVRLWVDNQNLINDWNDQPVAEHSASISLKAGKLYDVKMEYYNNSAGAVAELWWSSPSTPKMIIPQTQCYSSSAFSGFDFNALPLDPSGFTITLFNQWGQLNDFITLRNNFSGGEAGLIDVFMAALASIDLSKLSDATLNTLLAVTGWDAQALALLIAPAVFNLTDGDFTNATIILPKIVALQNCFSLNDRLGISFDHLLNWAAKEPDPGQAQDVKNTVKAQFDDDQWLTVAKTLNDGLRESQKAALIAYLLDMEVIKEKGISDSSQLYEYFLIDVDMSACMLTSRLVLANSSVQLFMQRCLMNLEQEVPPAVIATIDADIWNWMKRYRVWEAARKVFLYPENYIEPELRDDKTPFFSELETELLQNEVTMDTAEVAFLHYLDKLDQVSRLEICGMYWEGEPTAFLDWRIQPFAEVPLEVNILHVFGRTFSTPHIYYYRKLINGKLWTPWEKVDVDIEGDHLIPVVYNRRPRIIWPIFTEKTDQDQHAQTDLTPHQQADQKPSKQHLEIKLAWSDYKHGKWSQKQISKEFILSTFLEKGNHVFKAYTVEDSLLIIDVQAKFSQTSSVYLHGDMQGATDEVCLAVFLFSGCHASIQTIDPITNKDLPLCHSTLSAGDPGPPIVGVVPPEYSYPQFMTFEQSTDQAGLTLITGDFGNSNASYFDLINLKSMETDISTLNLTPSLYNLLYPTQFNQFVLQAPFFFQDSQRTYFVTPKYRDMAQELSKPNMVFPNFNRDQVISSKQDRGNPPIFTQLGSISKGGGSVAVANQMQMGEVTTLQKMPASRPQHIESVGLQMIGDLLSKTTLAGSPELAMAQRESAVIPSQAHSLVTQTDLLELLFVTHFHPYVCDFIKKLNRKGIPGLLMLENQEQSDSRLFLPPGEVGVLAKPTIFQRVYDPTDRVDIPYPEEGVDFSYGGPYSVYNWELFFQIPLLIATRLSKNQRFEEAQQWFHYIFNPTDGSPGPAPWRYWKVVPFLDTPQDRIQDLLALLDYKGPVQKTLNDRQQVEDQVEVWRHNPFSPHAIARLRLIAYQKSVVMKYIDNLIAWGDQLFRQDTMESINEATQLYVLAAQILGPRPEQIPPRGTTGDKTYYDLQKDLNSFSNTLVTLENQFPFSGGTPLPNTNGTGLSGDLGLGSTFYFCIPQNDQLLGYWDTVADRLFKIRNCMNIEGVVRQLALFAPPINPALLVQAAAMGIDLNSVLNDINAATPHYRFTYMLQKALELCNDVKSLGASLLAALEKKDAEAIGMLRATQETSLLKAVRLVKEQQLEEANTNKDALQKTLDVTTARYNDYKSRIDIGLVIQETTQLKELKIANDQQGSVSDYEFLGQILNMIPNISAGYPFSISSTFGGANLGQAAFAYSRYLGLDVSKHTYNANSNSILGGFYRRLEEWYLQLDLASKEIIQINKQIEAALIRATIAQFELDNHDKQIDNAQAVEDFLRDKYTNQDLYDWMVGQISAVYFQSYQMAYDTAKQVERTYRFERGLTTSDFITFGYWDSLKKGLLAGEQLYLDLKRLDMAYIDQNKREYEITKHISLVLFDPMALITLKETGECQVSLPEAFFDMDYPGHYMRRIKSVSLTIPCVTGPYTSINCTLTLLRSKIRIKSDNPESYQEQDDDPRFVTNFGAIESIATSTAQNDSGMFEVNFRDERYLPFEGSGAVSTWHIEMPRDCNAFDFETISDVIIKLNYTARDGGTQLRNNAKKVATLPPAGKQQSSKKIEPFPDQTDLTRLFSAKHEFSSDWYRFLHPTETATTQTLNLSMTKERFPFQYRGKTITINGLKLFLKLQDENKGLPLTFKLMQDGIEIPPPTADKPFAFTRIGSPVDKIPFVNIEGVNIVLNGQNVPVTLIFETQKGLANPDVIEDIWIISQYATS